MNNEFKVNLATAGRPLMDTTPWPTISKRLQYNIYVLKMENLREIVYFTFSRKLGVIILTFDWDLSVLSLVSSQLQRATPMMCDATSAAMTIHVILDITKFCFYQLRITTWPNTSIKGLIMDYARFMPGF